MSVSPAAPAFFLARPSLASCVCPRHRSSPCSLAFPTLERRKLHALGRELHHLPLTPSSAACWGDARVRVSVRDLLWPGLLLAAASTPPAAPASWNALCAPPWWSWVLPAFSWACCGRCPLGEPSESRTTRLPRACAFRALIACFRLASVSWPNVAWFAFSMILLYAALRGCLESFTSRDLEGLLAWRDSHRPAPDPLEPPNSHSAPRDSQHVRPDTPHRGGPARATRSFAVQIGRHSELEAGRAAAVAVIMFAVNLALAAPCGDGKKVAAAVPGIPDPHEGFAASLRVGRSSGRARTPAARRSAAASIMDRFVVGCRVRELLGAVQARLSSNLFTAKGETQGVHASKRRRYGHSRVAPSASRRRRNPSQHRTS